MQQPKVDPARLADLWALELTDREIARRVGLTRHTVAKWLRRAGLPARDQSAPAVREAKRLALTRRLARLAVGGLRALNPPDARLAAAKATLAESYGLPADLRPVQVALLVTLAGGPRTTGDLVRVLGRRRYRNVFHGFNCPRCAGGNYLTDLRARGLVVFVRQSRGPGGGSGRAEGVWLLSPAAMDLLGGTADVAPQG